MQPRNPFLCLAIVVTLAAFSLVGLGGILVLSLYGHNAPESVIALVGAAVGQLGSFLVQVPQRSVGGGHDGGEGKKA